MLIVTLLLFNCVVLIQTTDFDNARVVGLPRLICSKKSIVFNFETNIPFEGRVSVMKKMYIPECNQDFAVNIQKNATFKMDIGRCTETTYLNNGSRVLSAYVEIGFHPLVITSSDRVYSVQCVDNSYASVRPKTRTDEFNCTHVIRMAARWESVTAFHVGDAIVHEWTCTMNQKDQFETKMFLTSCNAISQAGQVIHLIDENGCIVDSELMGDLVYNNYQPRIYARAKMFKLTNGEKYRIECDLQMCRTNGTCSQRPFPPKCAFTKEEILNRYKEKTPSDDSSLMAGSLNMGFEKMVRVSSEWLNVLHNQYTNVEQLHERYFISTHMDSTIIEVKETAQSHFLMSISYRDPSKNKTSIEEPFEAAILKAKPMKFAPHAFKPKINPQIESSEEDYIETISSGVSGRSVVLPPNAAQAVLSSKWVSTSVIPRLETHSTTQSPTTVQLINNSNFSSSSGSVVGNTTVNITTSTRHTTTTKPFPSRVTNRPSPPSSMPNTFTTKGIHSTPNEKITKKSTSSVLRLQFLPTHPAAQTTTEVVTTEMPFEDNKIFSTDFTGTSLETTVTTPEATFTVTTAPERKISKTRTEENIQQKTEKFANPRDWRLDDRTINDTDTFSDRQIGCQNTTVIATQQKCGWSSLEHILLVWSFGSIIVWIILIATCLYKQGKSKPTWIEYRERELVRAQQLRVLQNEHPWTHADAFEEPKIRNKHEIDMNKF